MFTTFLFEKLKHLKYAYSTEEEMIKHFLSGEVTLPISDLLKYVEEYQFKNQLPSRFQIGDRVSVRFRPSLVIDAAEVIKVHFSENKVLYDLEVKIAPDNQEDVAYTRVYNIDSLIVSPV